MIRAMRSRTWASTITLVAFLCTNVAAQEEPALSQELGLVPDSVPSDEALAQEAVTALDMHRYVKARELADAILRANPDSPFGHATLGIVLHRAEGSLPRALYHLNRSLELFEQRYGAARFSPYRHWHLRALQEAAQLEGAMGRNEDKLERLEEYEQESGDSMAADRGWPLMRLRRYEEARQSVEEALNFGTRFFFDPQVRITAYNALCAIEGEQQHREKTYLACLRSAELDRQQVRRDPVAYTNAAIGALAMLKMDEAERLILEGSNHFTLGTVSNPWLDLMVLYIAQGRMAEALDAMRKMFEWRNRQPPYMDEQNRAQTDVASALFLLVAGRPFESARIARRALDRPDRTGYTSSDTEQMESATALVYTLACRAAAELRKEEASWTPWPKSLWLRYEALQLELRSWAASRRAASLLAADRILVSTVRPYLPGGAEIVEWVQLELPKLLGPGVVAAAVRTARERETLPTAEGYFLAFDAEIAWQQGEAKKTLERVEAALAALPGPEVLVQARLAAIAAQAAWELGKQEDAYAYFSRALQVDPGIVRRLGIALPTRFRAGSSEVARRAAELLQASPRFTEGGRFLVETVGDASDATACMLGPQGEVLGCARVSAQAGESDEEVARRLTEELHEVAFAPRIDLTQADIRSLDGSPTAAGGRSRERMKLILDGLVGPEER